MKSGLVNGSRIRELRERKLCVTIAKLAQTVGISEGALGNIETGSRQCSADVLQRIAGALEVEMVDLILPSTPQPAQVKEGDE